MINKENIYIKLHNIYYTIFILLFIFVLIFPLSKINNADKSMIEKRTLAKWPTLEIKGKFNKNYGNDFEKWISDRFRGRNKIISSYNKMNNHLLGRLENRRAMLGTDGFFFYKGNNSIANFQNKNIFKENELKEIKDNILLRRKLLEKHGIKYYVMVAPDKNRIYGEKYPGFIYKYRSQSRAEQLVLYLKKYGIDVIYPRQELLAGKKNGINYYHYDTHWNTLGAFTGYECIMKEIAKAIPGLKKLNITDFDIVPKIEKSGDLLPMLNITVQDIGHVNSDNLQLQKKSKYNYDYIKNKGREGVETSNSNPLNDLRLCMLRDSFTSSMEPYFSESFSHCVYIWDSNFNANYEKILSSNPDIVVQEIVERNLPNLKQNTPHISEEDSRLFIHALQTSAKQLKFHVDRKENREHIIHFSGWAFLNPKKTRDQKIYLLIEDGGGKQKVFSTGTVTRKDVGKHFKEELCNYSGFELIIDRKNLFQGTNIFKLIVVNDKEKSISPVFWELTL